MKNNTNMIAAQIRSKSWRVPVVRTGLAVILAAGLTMPMAGCAMLSRSSDATDRDCTYPEQVSPGSTEDDGYAYSEGSVGEESEVYDMELGYAPEANGMVAETDSYCPGPEYDYIDPFNTEEYGMLEEPGFVAVATNPLSTLSSDVDTASYCNLRRMLNDGYGPQEIPGGAVRIEEMLNYFDYNYTAPEDDNLFGVTVRMGDCPWNPDTKLLVMGFATAEEDQSVQEAGRNLVFLIDSSGSMDEPRKLPLLKQAFGELVGGLNENDRISIVTYSGTEEVLASGVPGNKNKAIMRAIRSIQADGCTNGEAGLQMAYKLAQENYIEGGVNRIIMASDGDLNVGMTSESDLYDYVSDMKETGVYLSVLGFGDGNYKDTKMETLADNGNGQYHYIDCEEEAKRVFGENLTANLVPLADDVKIQVEFNPAQVKGYRLIGYENRAMSEAEFEDKEADAGDIGPGHQFTVAYEIVPAGSEMDVPAASLKYGQDGDEGANDKDGNDSGGYDDATQFADEWATCTMRYKPVGHKDAEQQVVVGADDLSADPGTDWEFAAGIIEFGMLLRNSDYAGSATYDSAYDLAKGSMVEDDLREELCELIELAGEGGWNNSACYGDDVCYIDDIS